MMVERLFSLPSYKKSARQQCTVPFLWEEKPGTPKKNWKLEGVLVHRVGPPVKLITMVPFQWEEKPGTPLPSLSSPREKPQEKPLLMIEDSPALPLPPAKLAGFPPSLGNSRWSSRGKLRRVFSRMMNREGGDTSGAKQEDDDKRDGEEERVNEADGGREEETFDLDIEATALDKNESFGSPKCLLANCCVSKELISNAIPVDTNDEIPSPASETESYFSSSVNGSSSLTGSSFIECFFPPYSPDSEYPENADSRDGSHSPAFPDPREGNVVRKTPTLGELIRGSCRGCSRRSSLHVKKRNPSSEFMKGFGCCITGTENDVDATHTAQ